MYYMLQLRSMVLSPEERKMIEKERKANRIQRMDQSNERKKLMQYHELDRKKNEKPTDMEQVIIIINLLFYY